MGKSKENFAAFLSVADANGDGQLSKSEMRNFKKVLSQSFKVASTQGTKHPAMGASAILNGCPRHDPSIGMALVIIDPQNDFHPPNGSLGVPGAIEDSQRTISFIEKHGADIGRITVTLDTHHRMHIAHAAFWGDASGNSPAPFTHISAEDIEAGKWFARQDLMRPWSLLYAKKLEKTGREGCNSITIWPEHCLIGSEGHGVYPPLQKCITDWEHKQRREVTWVLKGQNNSTEMYSALKAEVPTRDDPATEMNTNLIDVLKSHTRVIICGQAKSHCVANTMRDLLSCWPKGRESDLMLLNDACSAVPGCEKAAEKFEAEMQAAGCTVCKTTEFPTVK